MSLHAMVMGTLVADPVRRTGQAGKEFVTASMRVPVEGGEAFLASLIAFSSIATEALAQHAKGDTIVVGGRGNLKSWQGRDGQEQHGLGVVVEEVMSEYAFGKRRKAMNGDIAGDDSDQGAGRLSPTKPQHFR
jgi:single-stranded DNA-binding protein